jgi:hypothetical protein
LPAPDALPDPTPAQLAEAARIDAVEGTGQAAGVVEGQASEASQPPPPASTSSSSARRTPSGASGPRSWRAATPGW